MELALALAALAAAVAACVLALRARAAALRLALEMVQLRDRLSRAERTRRDAEARADAAQGAAPSESSDALTARVARLEARLREALVQDLGAPAEPLQGGPDVGERRQRVRDHLRALGYERVAFLGAVEDGRVLVLEAERAGVTAKGRAAVDADGTVTFRALDTLRAFP